MSYRSALIAGLLFSSLGFGQSFEAAISGGTSRFGDAKLGTATGISSDPQYVMKDGFRLTFRMTLNSWRFFGHEFGYSYNHTSLDVPPITTSTGLAGTTTSPAQTISVPIHQGFYDFLAYATPEGTKIRPFAAGGVQFSSFVPPGTSIYYGNQVTKYGINYGGGLKFRVTSIWGIRFDVRFYNMGKPFNFPNQSGRLIQQEYSVGATFNL
ncbi:MAG TPA: outer membrane beta-barrel protein [Bryobacteraceae bacterium]|nr:outer membrane beta-barrel protein [Bryobacteraceae bacterium]